MQRHRLQQPSDQVNILELNIGNLTDIKPFYNGNRSGLYIKFTNYNIEDVLTQLIEEYGEEKILELIKNG